MVSIVLTDLFLFATIGWDIFFQKKVGDEN
jgi:hypothetical protein